MRQKASGWKAAGTTIVPPLASVASAIDTRPCTWNSGITHRPTSLAPRPSVAAVSRAAVATFICERTTRLAGPRVPLDDSTSVRSPTASSDSDVRRTLPDILSALSAPSRDNTPSPPRETVKTRDREAAARRIRWVAPEDSTTIAGAVRSSADANSVSSSVACISTAGAIDDVAMSVAICAAPFGMAMATLSVRPTPPSTRAPARISICVRSAPYVSRTSASGETIAVAAVGCGAMRSKIGDANVAASCFTCGMPVSKGAGYDTLATRSMRHRRTRVICGAIAWIVLVAAGISFYKSEKEIDAMRSAQRAFDQLSRETTDALAELRASQQAYVVGGQGVAFWVAKVVTTGDAVHASLATLAQSATSPVTRTALENAVKSLKQFAAADKRALEYINGGQPLMANDVIFTEGGQSASGAAQHVEAARLAERQDGESREAAARRQQVLHPGSSALLLGVVVLLLVPSAADVRIDERRQPMPAADEVRAQAYSWVQDT